MRRIHGTDVTEKYFNEEGIETQQLESPAVQSGKYFHIYLGNIRLLPVAVASATQVKLKGCRAAAKHFNMIIRNVTVPENSTGK